MDGGLDQARSLREIFASMSHGSADPATALAQAGHGDLPAHLVTEAVISYADSAPVEVAEHLQPYVVANSAVPAPEGYDDHPGGELPDAFALLTSAPAPLDVHHGDDLYGVHSGDQHSVLDDGIHHDLHDGLHDPLHDGFHDQLHDGARDAADHDAHHGDDGGHADLWFGHGQAEALAPHPLGDALAGTDDAAQHPFAEAGHSDPWLAGAGDTVPEHADGGDLALWNPDVHATDPAGHELDQPHEHQPVPVEDPAAHDLPLDGGHAGA